MLHTTSLRFPRLTLVRNRGELLEGWYDPETLQKAIASPTGISPITSRQSKRASPEYGNEPKKNEAVDLSSDDDSVGPSLPGQDLQNTAKGRKPGPAIPNLQDLELRRGEHSIYVKDSIIEHHAMV